MNRNMVDLWVGFFVALGLAAVVFLSLKVANQSSFRSAPSYEVHAYFTNIGGLKIHSPVKSAGVVIGRVSDIQFDTNNYQARVSMALDNRYRFSVDSSASIITSGLLGEQYIGIEVGADDSLLADGDNIEFTSSALLLEKLIGAFGLNQVSGDKKSVDE
ncbi:outer membrane lipid asymmetry maintenance protein MlaD [Cellvibrio sp. PSBB006]|uniref:outer membrane lipid asymmetry maintenance protein MlaD n=1 Tax=Cellvibrio sp. PSBB006 TaxID=1987723 RepID=UPI000B3B21C9|nr:outer membrane lipid asymmetry maintenance protein MlaD [Cellvibrio sp. PSBB006]ARU29460.1 outer membrane lipid asymmetry maintenance protein MlaD [Cellvibrio sp. PSBB006]